MVQQTVTLPKKDLLRPEEVAAYFSMSVKTLYGWIAEGKIEAVRIGPSRVLRITKEAVEKIIQPAIQ
jgi:excisionase family DNA binding protein